MKRYYGPEYNKEITIEEMTKQYSWFIEHGMAKTLEQFINDNFKVVNSKKELKSWIEA